MVGQFSHYQLIPIGIEFFCGSNDESGCIQYRLDGLPEIMECHGEMILK